VIASDTGDRSGLVCESAGAGGRIACRRVESTRRVARLGQGHWSASCPERAASGGHTLCRTSRITPEMIDPTNPVVVLCAEGMAADGTPAEARRLFERAWAARRDDYDAAIAAHFLARHQPSAADTLHWNALAVRLAEAVPGGLRVRRRPTRVGS